MERDIINPKETRENVYKAIDSERTYQAWVADGKGTGKFQEVAKVIPKSVGDYMIMMQGYMNIATDTWISTQGIEPTLHIIRKIAGIAVKCMEQHGAPLRELKEKQ